jgi:hypothetical protein
MKPIFYLVVTSLLFSTPNLHSAPVQHTDYLGNAVPQKSGAVLSSRYSYAEEVWQHLVADSDPELDGTLPPINNDEPAFFDLLAQAKDKNIDGENFIIQIDVYSARYRLEQMKSIGQKFPRRISIVAHGGKEFIHIQTGPGDASTTIRFEGRKLAKQLAPFIEDDSLIDIVACTACEFTERFAAELKKLGVRARVRGFASILTPSAENTLRFTEVEEGVVLETDYREFLLTGEINESVHNALEGHVVGYDTSLEDINIDADKVVKWVKHDELETCL